MKKNALIAAGMLWMLAGCQSSGREEFSDSVAGLPVELPLLYCPANFAKCELMPLQAPAIEKRRSCIVYDLNTDGSPEYFVENYTGANLVGFALVDSMGKLLTVPEDVGNLGGDRLVILASKHHGYYDLICSSWAPGEIDGARWEFNGTVYVKTKTLKYEGERMKEAFLEKIPGIVVVRWYGDVFGRPPGDRPPNWFGQAAR